MAKLILRCARQIQPVPREIRLVHSYKLEMTKIFILIIMLVLKFLCAILSQLPAASEVLNEAVSNVPENLHKVLYLEKDDLEYFEVETSEIFQK